MKKILLSGVAGLATIIAAPAAGEPMPAPAPVVSEAAPQGADTKDARPSTAAARRDAKRKRRQARVKTVNAAKAVREEQQEARRAERVAKSGNGAMNSNDILVTGTRIQSNAGKTGAPVQSVSREELRRRGLAHLEDVMNQLPQTAPVLGALRTDEQGGKAGVNLRGLGTGRTLVLINGQRATNDTNAIPAAMVERVDVLTGGASAVYGSDAIGGVVNYIVKRNFSGLTLTGELQTIQHTNRLDEVRSIVQQANLPLPQKNALGGPRGYLNAVTGFNFGDGAKGEGNVSFNAGYNRTGNLLSTAYDNTACGLYTRQPYSAPPGTPNDNTQLACFTPPTYNPYGLFAVRGNTRDGVDRDGNIVFKELTGSRRGDYSNAVNGSKQFRQYTESDLVPIITPGYVYREDQRYYFGTALHYDFGQGGLQYNMSANYTRFQNQSDALEGASIESDVQLNCDNPFLSAQQATIICGEKAGDPNTLANVFVRYHPEGWTNYFQYNFKETFITNQILGKVTNDIRFEINANRRTHNDFWRQNAYYYGDFNGRAFTNAIRARRINGEIVCLAPQDAYSTNPKVAAAQRAIDARCKPLDIFSANAPDKDIINDVIVNPGSQSFYNTENLVNGTVSGGLGAYGIRSPWATDAVGFSLTMERRTNTFEQKSTGFNSTYILPFVTSTTTTEFAGELSLPIMQDKPFVKYIQVNGAARQGFYTTRGITQKALTWRGGGTWTPTDGVQFRGSYSRSLRVPIFEAVEPQRIIQEPLFDPCSPQKSTSGTARLSFEQCARTGVTRQQYDALSSRSPDDCNEGYCPANLLVGGNPDLKPEKSQSITVGATFTPSFIKNFDLSIDLYKIKITSSFINLNPYDSFNQCLKGQTFYCSIYHRDPTSGRLNVPGAYGDRTRTNAGFDDTRGIDIITNYRVDLLELVKKDLGAIGFNFNGNLRMKHNLQVSPGQIPYDCTGFFGPFCGSQPGWRHTLRTVWATPWSGLSINGLWRHTSGQRWSGLSDNPTLRAVANPFDTGTLGPDFRQYPTADYFDLGFEVGLAKDASFRMNISNIFDRRPHIVPNGWLGTEPGIYDALGRNITVGFNARF